MNSSNFFNFCNIRGNGVFGQNRLLQISFLYVLIKMWVDIYCHVFWQDPFKLFGSSENGKCFRMLLILFHFLWFFTLFTLPWKGLSFFPAFYFVFTLTLLVANARRGGSWTLLHFLRFILQTFLHLLFWCISLLYLITGVRFSFIISVNFFSFAGLAPSSANGENKKKDRRGLGTRPWRFG